MFRSDGERSFMRLPPRTEGRVDRLLSVFNIALVIAAFLFFTQGGLSAEAMRLSISIFVFCLVFLTVLKEARYATSWPKALGLALLLATLTAAIVFFHPPVQ